MPSNLSARYCFLNKPSKLQAISFFANGSSFLQNVLNSDQYFKYVKYDKKVTQFDGSIFLITQNIVLIILLTFLNCVENLSQCPASTINAFENLVHSWLTPSNIYPFLWLPHRGLIQFFFLSIVIDTKNTKKHSDIRLKPSITHFVMTRWFLKMWDNLQILITVGINWN